MQSWIPEAQTQQKGEEQATEEPRTERRLNLGPSPNWFAAYTLSRHEKRTAQILSARQIESFLPLYTALHRWRNRCAKNIDLPLFPNYVFVRIAPRERRRVLEVPGVVSLVGFGRTLAPLPAPQIEALRSGISQRKLEPHPYLVVGEKVRIKTGAMSGLEGVLIRKKNHFRIVLALDVIMQSVAVEVDALDLEPAAKPTNCSATRRPPVDGPQTPAYRYVSSG
jgi:transcription antitermination factor NusG